MRKVNSKPSLGIQQPATHQISGLSPLTSKQQSMIQLYKVKAQNYNTCQTALTGKQAATLISKTISSRRQNNINVQNGKQHQTNKDQQLDNNVSAQTVKPTRLFSPGDTLLRKNETIMGIREGRDKSPNINMFQIPERNLRQQLQKDKSAKCLLSGTQRLTKNQSTKNLSSSNQRHATHRGAKYIASGTTDTNKQNQSMTHMFKSTFNMTRNRSQYLTLNNTSKMQNYTTVDVKQAQKEIMSPCISSDDEKSTPYKPQALNSKGNQMPNGSFIEKKMQNCLQSRNITQEPLFAANFGYNAFNTQRQILSKNMSQPQLYSEAVTHRPNIIKTSLPNNGKPESRKNIISKPLVKEFTGDIKSLNLSPIIPQNVGIVQRCESSDKKAMITTQKRLQLSSVKKHYGSQQKDSQPTTEKKGKDKVINMKSMKGRPGYISQETEKAPGATHSYSTADDFHVSVQEFRKHFNNHDDVALRKANNENIVTNKQFETVIKVTQILNNNKMNNNKRYNVAVTPDYIPSQALNQQQQVLQNKTPKAIPNFSRDLKGSLQNQIYAANDDDKTQKKDHHQSMSFDEEDDEDELNSKDFDEFAPDEIQVVIEQDEKQQTFGEPLPILKEINSNKYGVNTARQTIYNTGKEEDRNSIVNYDNSLLTYNTFRENHASPMTQMRQQISKPQQPRPQPQHQENLFLTQSNSFIIPYTEDDGNLTKEIMMTKTDEDLLSDDENGAATISRGKRQVITEMDSKYKAFIIKIQKEEELAIQKLKKQIVDSGKYKNMTSLKAKEQYLADNIEKVKKQFRQLLIDKIFNQGV